MGAEMDRLEVAVETQASKANQQLDLLINKLTKVASVLTGVNMGGFASMAAGVRNLSSAMKTMSGVKTSDFKKIADGVTKLGGVDTENLYKSSNAIRNFANSITALSGISVPEMDTKNVKPIINAVKNLLDVDTGKSQQIAGSVQQVVSAIGTLGTVNVKDSGINNTVNALRRLVEVDLGRFDPTVFGQITQTIAGLGAMPDVSNSLNRFMSSLAKLVGAGNNAVLVSQSLPQLGDALLDVTNKMAGAQDVSESVNMFTQSIGRLASAGNKTMQTAAGLQTLADETLKFFQAMTKAPRISKNTLAMTQALAQLAAAGGKVGAAGNTVQSAFSKMQKAGNSALNSIKRAASGILSSFRNIGNSSGYLNKATVSLRGLFKAILPIIGIRQLFNWGKQAIEISSDLTEVQNVVDTTFGDFKDKIEDFSKVSIQDFGMSELTAKQISSRFQAMGVAMGFSQGKMADMSVELTKLAADMASFYNVEQKDVAESLESIFTGQTRPLRTYGLDLTQATIQEWALKQGLDADISSMSQAEKTLLRYQYVMANTTAAQGDFAKTADTWANQIRILGQSFQVLGSTIGGVLINAFKPLISWLNAVMLKVISVVKTIANALGAIFGWTMEVTPGGATSDYDDIADGVGDVENAADGAADSLGGANEQAKKLKRTLLGFDEINKLDDPTTSTNGTGSSDAGGNGTAGSGAAGDAAAGSAQLVRTDSILEKYKSEIKNLEQLGEYIGGALTKAMQSIDWDKVYSAAKDFGTGLASFLNGLISPELFGETGRLIANSLNTALYALNSFGETFDWTNLGNSIATGVNKFFKNFKFDLAADTFDVYVNGIVDTMAEAARNAEWGMFGKKIVGFVQNALAGIEWKDVYAAARGFGNGLARFLNNLITPEVFSEIGGTLAGVLNTVVSGAYSLLGTINWEQWGDAIGTSINDFFNNLDWYKAGLTFYEGAHGIFIAMTKALETVNWEEFGRKIVRFLKGCHWRELLSDIGKLIWKAINAAIETWTQLFKEKPVETAIVTALLGLKFTGISSFLGKILWGRINGSILGKTVTSNTSTTIGNGVFSTIKKGIVSALTSNAGILAVEISGALGVAFAQVKVNEYSGGPELMFKSIGEWIGGNLAKIPENKSVQSGVEKLRDFLKNIYSKIGVKLSYDDNETTPEIEVSIEAQDNTDRGVSSAKKNLSENLPNETSVNIETNNNTETGILSAKASLKTLPSATDVEVNAKDNTRNPIESIKKMLSTIPAVMGIDFSANTIMATLTIGAFQLVVKGLSTLFGETASDAEKSSTEVGKSAGNIGSSMSNSTAPINNFYQTLLNGAENVNTKIPSRFNGVVSAIKNLAGNILTESKTAGENYSQGIVNGVESKSKEIKKAGKGIIDNLNETMEAEADMHSPSKVAEGHGQNYVQGFIVGFTAMTQAALEKAKDMIAKLKSLFSAENSAFLKFGKDYMTYFIKGMNSIANNISNTAKRIASTAVNAFSSSNSALYTAGANAMKAFANGMKSIHVPTPHLYASSWTTHYTNAEKTAWYQTPNFSVSWYAKGGFPEMGQLFIANEKGPEMIGKMGKRNVVANNMQIAEGIKQAVVEGIMEVVLATQQNSQSESGAPVLEFTWKTGEETLYKAVRKGKEKYDGRYNVVVEF